VITVENLCVRAGTFELKNVSFEIGGGEYGILMGRTGSGKTTILEAVCGLKRIVSGKVFLSGRDVTGLKPAERGIGFVPQEGALFPTMRIRDQIGFSLSIRRRPRAEIKRRVDELAELLDIVPLLDRFPEGLSGGERQRIALGRALAARPGVLCLDEPLSALDDASREDMYALLESIRKVTGVTTLHITHSRSEARRLGSRVFFVHDGQIEPFDLGASPVADAADDLNGGGVIDSKTVKA
jgi:ABC-type sugar transport system ATPase subunit